MNIIREGTYKEFWAQLHYITLNKAEVTVKYQKRSSTYNYTRESVFFPNGLSLISLSPSLNDERIQSKSFYYSAGVLSLNLSGLIISFPVCLKPEDAGVTFLPLTEGDGIVCMLLAVFSAFWGCIQSTIEDIFIFQLLNTTSCWLSEYSP